MKFDDLSQSAKDNAIECARACAVNDDFIAGCVDEMMDNDFAEGWDADSYEYNVERNRFIIALVYRNKYTHPDYIYAVSDDGKAKVNVDVSDMSCAMLKNVCKLANAAYGLCLDITMAGDEDCLDDILSDFEWDEDGNIIRGDDDTDDE